VAAGDEDGDAYLWDVAARQKVATLPGVRSGSVSSLTFNPAGNILAVGNTFPATYLWRITGAPKFART
jgi:WD40 repeat protein